MTGMSHAGVGLTINNLRSTDAHVGLVWPALVRRALREPTATAARDVVTKAPLGSGHHYLVADASRAYGIETSGRLVDVWAEVDVSRPGTGFHHENHCLGRVVEAASTISPVSTTKERHAFLEASIRARPIESAEDLWSRLGSHDGSPRSVCTHLSSAKEPHAMETCGGVLFELAKQRVSAIAGCLHDRTPVGLPWD
jgi:isopenicillin-N N-acyltransferase like protein